MHGCNQTVEKNTREFSHILSAVEEDACNVSKIQIALSDTH
jgi:hypothetical protein